jgi:hypothetical protein
MSSGHDTDPNDTVKSSNPAPPTEDDPYETNKLADLPAPVRDHIKSQDSADDAAAAMPIEGSSAPDVEDLDAVLPDDADDLGSQTTQERNDRLTFTNLTEANGIITPGITEHWFRHRILHLISVARESTAFADDPDYVHIKDTTPDTNTRAATVPCELTGYRADGSKWIARDTEYVFVTCARLWERNAAWVILADTYREWKGYDLQFRYESDDEDEDAEDGAADSGR